VLLSCALGDCFGMDLSPLSWWCGVNALNVPEGLPDEITQFLS